MSHYRHLHVTRDWRGVQTIGFDVAGRSHNVLNEEVLSELNCLVEPNIATSLVDHVPQLTDTHVGYRARTRHGDGSATHRVEMVP